MTFEGPELNMVHQKATTATKRRLPSPVPDVAKTRRYQRFSKLFVVCFVVAPLIFKMFSVSPGARRQLRERGFATKAEYRFCAGARGGKYQSLLWKVSWKHERRSVPDLFAGMCQNPYLHKSTQGLWCVISYTKRRKPDLVTHVRFVQVQVWRRPVE